MSSCISGGGRSYALDIEIPKPPSPSTLIRTPHSSSPCSTLSESSSISTRKPRTPRKRPNQTYIEAAALLSMAYPKIFSPKHLPSRPCKVVVAAAAAASLDSPSDLLMPFRPIDHLGPPPPRFRPKVLAGSNCLPTCDGDDGYEDLRKLVGCASPGLSKFAQRCSMVCCGEEEDLDAESILDEEIGEGIDSIMGDDDCNAAAAAYHNVGYSDGWTFGGKLECGGFGNVTLAAALRSVDREGEWWRFPTVDIRQISPKLNRVLPEEKKKKKKKKKKKEEEEEKKSSSSSSEGVENRRKKENSVPIPRAKAIDSASRVKKSSDDSTRVDSIPNPNPQPPALLLNLNYDEVLRAWSDQGQGSPFPETIDTHARLAQMDLFAENGSGVREASVLRYKEKRRTRLFSKKIRYQVRKVNADLRPRMKGRFVRKPNPTSLLKGENEA